MVAEVYSREEKVCLYQNGKLVGKQKRKKDTGRFYFKIKYIPGTIEAVSYDKEGKEKARTSLSTVKKETFFEAKPEKDTLKANETGFVKLTFVDVDGRQKPLENSDIVVTEVENGSLLGLGNACPYFTGTYLDNITPAYYGRAQAIVRPNGNGDLKIHFKTKCGENVVTIKVVPANAIEDFHI